jgi:hypothetical protein
MTEAQEDAINELRRRACSKYTSALAGYCVDVSVEDVKEVLGLIEELEAEIAELKGE